MNSDKRRVNEIIGMWKTKESPDFRYYDQFDREDTTAPFWVEGGLFQTVFAQLDLARTLEIACGTGRHAARILDRAGQLYVLDTSVDALKVARERFSTHPNVTILLSEDGETIALPGGSLTAVFSYDAMVHFEATTVANYMAETARVLSCGGRALFHHSVYDRNPTGNFRDNPGWRNFMTQSLFAYLASRSGLKIINTVVFNEWQGGCKIDGLTLMEKAG